MINNKIIVDYGPLLTRYTALKQLYGFGTKFDWCIFELIPILLSNSKVCENCVKCVCTLLAHLSQRLWEAYIVELPWFKHLWNHEKMFETGIVRAYEY